MRLIEEERRYPGRRVYNAGENVASWADDTGNGDSTIDLCEDDAQKLDRNPHCFDGILLPYGNGEPVGEDGWTGDVEHPPYDDNEYRCAVCRALLGD